MHCSFKEIWLLLDSSTLGGIETHVLELAKGLNNYNIMTRVVLMKNYGHHPLVDKLDNHKIPYAIASPGNSLIALCRNYSPCIIHTHGYKAGIIGRLLANFFSIQAVSTYHSGEEPKGKMKVYDWLDRYTAYLCNHVFSVSEKVASRLPCLSEVINNFIDIDSISTSHGDQIAFVGRLSHEKGPDILKDIAELQPSLNFHIYGDGPLMQSLQNTPPRNMKYHGLQKNMDSVWSNIGLVVITSRYEGLPMAAIEAMARGIPVIAFNVGALSSLIDHSYNGWLVEPGNINAFSQLLTHWNLLSKEEKNKMRHSATNKVAKQFSSNAVIPRYIQCYQSLVTVKPELNAIK